ncbi:hypothetical protein F5Y18DRAFT_166701 [Xylariaceae sp. FL1019]|nr:hypothetical protein F5Y18DRAFT_166701 [Xylariaceae sp. FL1019]
MRLHLEYLAPSPHPDIVITQERHGQRSTRSVSAIRRYGNLDVDIAMDPAQLRARTPGPRAAMVRELGPAVLSGCCKEAERADIVSMSLEGLRNTLPEGLQIELTHLIKEIRSTSYLLRDLADRSQVHLNRVPAVYVIYILYDERLTAYRTQKIRINPCADNFYTQESII